MKYSPRNLWMSSRDYMFIAFGIFLYAFGFSAFIFPEKVVMGGLAGFGTLVYFITERLFGYGIPVAVTSYAMNLFLLALAFRSVGKQFVIRTIFGATCISLFIGLLQPFFPEPMVQQQTFMNIIIGAILCGIGIGVAFTHNGSTGGTDIIAAMVSKHSNVTIGRMMLYVDMCIISSSFILFHQIDKVVYGFVILVIVSYMADLIIDTSRQAVQFTIFSPHWEKIATEINNKANRGCTVIDGMGWYTRRDVKILLVMCRKIESVTIFRIIKNIDENAFITQANVNGVYGEGFDALKLRVPPKKAHDHSTPEQRANDDADVMA